MYASEALTKLDAMYAVETLEAVEAAVEAVALRRRMGGALVCLCRVCTMVSTRPWPPALRLVAAACPHNRVFLLPVLRGLASWLTFLVGVADGNYTQR